LRTAKCLLLNLMIDFSLPSPKWCMIIIFHSFKIKICEPWRHTFTGIRVLDGIGCWDVYIHLPSGQIAHQYHMYLPPWITICEFLLSSLSNKFQPIRGKAQNL
jgi:hypothetical protein